jgi:UDP-N-acetyl-D-glucosamine dehydrogenase
MSIQPNTANPAAAAAIALVARADEKGSAAEAVRRIESREATVGVVGVGYVGLPLAMAAARVGFRTTGFDLDPQKPALLNSGHSYIGTISSEEVRGHVEAGRFHATDDFSGLAACDVILICVPTPLTRQREPDLSHVEATARIVARHLQPGQLIVLESTTYPGTTREVIKPILEQGELRSGVDFFLGFSPEREDPGNPNFATVTIPKVVAGDGPDASQVVEAFYGAVMDRIVPVSSLDVAEAVKITENVFRAVNIALVNELKMVFERMGIDVWEVIEAAKTKPFGYMPFYPGPGLGGHCIPIDPFYLTWKAREYDIATRFIELAGEINTAMPHHVVERLARALDERFAKGLNGARILIVGLAYKKNVDDTRESPAYTIMELLERRGAKLAYHDPHVAAVPQTREHPEFAGMRSLALEPAALGAFDAALIVTDHDGVDYETLVAAMPLVVDSRNATKNVSASRERIVRV